MRIDGAPRGAVTCALILLSILLAAAPRASAATLSGHIKSVAADLRSFVVTDAATGRDYTVRATDRTRIETTDGHRLTLGDLKPGDGVGIAYTGGVASAIRVSPRPAAVAPTATELTGHVQSVAPDLRSFVIAETATGTAVTVTVTDRTLIQTTDGRRLTLKDLKPGDGVGIAHRGSIASKVTVNARPIAPPTAARSVTELTGHVRSVAPDLRSFVVAETATGTPVTVAVTDRTLIETTDGRRLTLKDLKPGDGVGIAHRGSIASRVVVNARPGG
ncbi:MAG: hypothetical protein IRY99_16575 [Isosphaeraceae bacterium]|nr:hypothetical protein [Isosphaeraceae bacterium]